MIEFAQYIMNCKEMTMNGIIRNEGKSRWGDKEEVIGKDNWRTLRVS